MATKLWKKITQAVWNCFVCLPRCWCHHSVIYDQAYAAKKHEWSTLSPCFSEAEAL